MDDLFRLFPELPRARQRSTADAIFSDQQRRVAFVQRRARLNAARQMATADRIREAVEQRRVRHLSDRSTQQLGRRAK